VGSWQEAIDSNLASLAAARAWVVKSQRTELWDMQAHAQDYLLRAAVRNGYNAGCIVMQSLTLTGPTSTSF